MANVAEISDSGFEGKVLASQQVVLIDRLEVYKVDTGRHRAAAAKYGVRGVPTLVLFKAGKVVGQLVGAQAKARLQDLVQKAF